MKLFKRKNLLIIFAVILLVFTISVVKSNNNLNEQTVLTSASAKLDNTKIGWGIKRAKNNEQPDLGSKNKKLIEEAKGIAMGNKEKPYVYLTFDLGYEGGYTEKILDTLKENNVVGVFFITGHYLNSATELVKRMIDEGHIVGNHTVNHYSMPDLSEEEIKKEIQNLHTALYEKFGYEMTYVRPPKGEFSQRTLSICNSLGYKTVMWSLAYDDWDTNKQRKTAIC